MNTVYEAYTRRIAFEGSQDECRKWILDQAYTMADGRKIFSTWAQDGDMYWDVGCVYIYNGDQEN